MDPDDTAARQVVIGTIRDGGSVLVSVVPCCGTTIPAAAFALGRRAGYGGSLVVPCRGYDVLPALMLLDLLEEEGVRVGPADVVRRLRDAR